MKIWALVPAYNEEIGLASFLFKIKEKGLLALVVDDGSTDDTYRVAKESADVVIKNRINSGKGFSLKKGIKYLKEEKDFDYLITMDADGQHSPEDLNKFIGAAAAGSQFVIGNRMKNPVGMPKVRIFTNKAMSWLISKIAGQKIPDSQCGFRLIKKEVIEKMSIKTKKFEIESEVLINVSRLGYLIESMPVKSIYSQNFSSKIRPFSDTWRFFKFIFGFNNESEKF